MIFFRIVLPLSTPALASLAIFQFVWVWNDLLNALIFLQDSKMMPLTAGIRELLGQYGSQWNLLGGRRLYFDDRAIDDLLLFTALFRARSDRRGSKRLIQG